MPVEYPVCECNACGSAIQGPMVLLPTGTESGKYIAEPFHLKCAGQSFASESASQVMGAGRWLAELTAELTDSERSDRVKKRRRK